LDWTIRRGTRAGQKYPPEHEEVCRKFILRVASVVRDEDVPASCIVNCDQTGKTYASGNKVTYAPVGSKQVAIVGAEEKRAFTIVVGVSASGKALPFQAVYQGSSKVSLPQGTPGCNEAKELGIRFENSKTKTYWSTLDTMCTYVRDVLVPYLEEQRALLGRPDQQCIWIIDVWSVHRSKAFRGWMKRYYVWIIVIFIPGGCTGL
ncbi:uncharacterized protein B0H18DRAFT_857816, partial [Fomitopsis serialis]|uniref:uncharacterized protein n=1 Tax=Fomitopsis serialis TaxID=139415 RepID=UPI0020075CEC